MILQHMALLAAEVGMFAVLGQDALLQQEGTYVPDFCASPRRPGIRLVYISIGICERHLDSSLVSVS